jgi:uncharacterized protein YdhG (YjbR/CyaY superfamily)
MAKTRFTSIDEYISQQPPKVQRVLERLRGIIRNAVPDAEETISYQIPAFKVGGRTVIYFAGWTEHYSIYPSSRALETAFKDELALYEISKGTIRFPLSKPIPAKLIANIARFRAKETAALAKAKSPARKKR